MAEKQPTFGPSDLPFASEDLFVLPTVEPAVEEGSRADDGESRTSYFDPRRWDTEMVAGAGVDDQDPVATRRGHCEGRAQAVLLFSDFHLADGSAAGDDFLDSHLVADEAVEGLYAGFSPPGQSRTPLVQAVVAFARQRVAERAVADAGLDVVLNGDVINGLELRGRGGSFVSAKHRAFFRTFSELRPHAAVYWLRGNHDYRVPTGDWTAGEFYTNSALQLLAEHGDFWDKQNWPPGPGNQGSRLAIEAGASFEVHAAVLDDDSIKYLMSGIDNLRPWSQDAIEGFLDRRSKYSDIAFLAAALARIKFVGGADDSAAFKGAQQRRKLPAYRDWLMVQGHTHVPALVPETYYNTGTWITTLVAQKGKERLVEAFPFLLVYRDRTGRRVEEYFFVGRPTPGEPAVAIRQTAASVEQFRTVIGYPALQ